MAKKKYTAAVIGTGRIGFTLGFDRKREQPASHTMALRSNRRVNLVAGCDNNGPRLAHWHRFNQKCAVYSDYSYLFAAERPDIVVVSVNEDAHMQATLAAIRAKPRLIILEKPVALNMEQGRRIQAEAKNAGVPVLVNHERRFADDYRIARNYMLKIGDIQTINARLDSGLYVYNPEKESNGEYSLLHDGTHLVDIVNYLLESKAPEEVSEGSMLKEMKITKITYDKEKPEIVRNLNVHFESSECPDINVFMSGRSKYFGFEVEVIGTLGRFKIGNGIHQFQQREESKLYTGFYSLADDRTLKFPKKTKYFSNMVKNAVEFLDGKAPLRSTLQTGLNTLEVLENMVNHIKINM